MHAKTRFAFTMYAFAALTAGQTIGTAFGAESGSLSDTELLGKNLFFDSSLSSPAGQSCSSCHVQEAGFGGLAVRENGAVEPGALDGRFGNRRAPAITYAAYSPVFHFDEKEGLYIGGQFWDGRAATLEEQAGQPMLNPLEMNNESAKEVCTKVVQAEYAGDFKSVFGTMPDCSGDASSGFTLIGRALAAYERSSEMNPFTSKFDYFKAGQATLSEQEKYGLELFNNEKKGNCAACHPSESQQAGVPALFTDFSYDNLGLPANENNPFYSQDPGFNPYGEDWKDRGVGAVVDVAELMGAFKVPTLRNVTAVPDENVKRPYGHNGVMDSLKTVVHFYNTRDLKDEMWAEPEFPGTMNREELGNLKLSEEEEDAIVAFLHTLRDGFDPAAGRYPD